MKAIQALKSLAVVALLSLSIPGLTFTSAANASTRTFRTVQYEQEVASFNRVEYRVASGAMYCRRVNTNGGRLNVRSYPGGRIIAKITNGSYIRIVSRRGDGWVRIASPVRGYVSARYLSYC